MQCYTTIAQAEQGFAKKEPAMVVIAGSGPTSGA
jgi:hypothetical protein